MRKLVFLPILALLVACSDATIAEPDLAVSPELAVAQKAGGKGDVVKMVPLKMKGTWAYATRGDATPCDAYPESTPRFIEFGGTATHMGRIQGTATNCMDYSGLLNDPPVVAILSQTTTIQAANGDLLFAQGTVGDDPPIELTFDPGVWYKIGPSLFTGGTGRFENASGWSMLRGDYSKGDGGNFSIEGKISSVGSSK